uniref:Retrotransposon gag domain-containing protein n=1 Tax=Tanacetum cinerariifolium TaxID=118510 RepID=A0A6L2MKM5_TANCI|nr:hypothetical protein [Tanacetum cinerariifolium]
MSSSDSTVTYTSVSSEDVPFWGIRFFGIEQPDSPEAALQGRAHPEEYEDDETEDGLVDYPMDGGDDGDDDDGDSSGDDADDADEEEEEEHLALADSAIVIPTDELVSPPEGIYLVIPPPSTDTTTTGARITVRLQVAISFPPEAEVERLLAMPTPPPSPLASLSPPSGGEHLARCTTPSACPSPPPMPSPLLPSSRCPTQIQTLRLASTQALIDVVTAAIPSPPLPPPLYIPPSVDRWDDILEIEMPPHKRLCLSTLGSKYEIEESSTARPTKDRGIDYRFVSTLDAEARRRGIREIGYGIRDTWVDPAETVPGIAPMTVREVNTRVTKLAELHEHDTHDLYALLEDALDSRTRISQRVAMESQRFDLLMEDRLAHHETIHIMEEEAYAAREARQAQMVETLLVMGDMRREMGDMQAELLALREHPRRARQLGGMLESLITRMLLGMLIVTSHEDNQRNMQTARPCFYADFMKCQPLNFKGTEGMVGLTRWIEKMESIFQISGCGIENQVKFATCTLLDVSLTWWNSQIRSLGPDVYSMTWEVLKKKMTDKYYPQGEIKMLEIELWNLKFIANETEKIDKYVSGLPDNIYESVKASKPKTLDETIELANDLMDQKLHAYTERQTNNKRKADDSFRNNHGHQQQPLKGKCRQGLQYGDGRKEAVQWKFAQSDCPKLKNKDGGNVNAQGWVYVVGNAKRKGNALRDLDSNVITGSFLLKNRYASILFDTGADRSFISTTFSSLIEIVPTPLGNNYDVKLADGKIVEVDLKNFLDRVSSSKRRIF